MKKILIIAILIPLFAACNQDEEAFLKNKKTLLRGKNKGCSSIEGCADAYVYSVDKNSEKFKSLSSQEKINVSQIPVSQLKNISTQGLIESVLNNPLYMEIYLSSSTHQRGFDGVRKNFNGLKELLLKKDLAIELINRYIQMNPACKTNDWPSINGKGTSKNYSFSMIELLIAQKEVVTQLINAGLQKEVVNIVLDKNFVKENTKEYNIVGFKDSYTLISRIMYYSNYNPFLEGLAQNNQYKWAMLNEFELPDYFDFIKNSAQKFVK